MLRTVVLRHELPDGSWHYDWLLEMPRAERERRLMTFRVPAPPHEWPPGGLCGVRIGDHRELYLSFEGELSGGRGRVQRVAEGVYGVAAAGEGTMELELRFEAWPAAKRVTGRREGSGGEAPGQGEVREIWNFSLRP